MLPSLTDEARASLDRYGVSASTVRDVLETVLTWSGDAFPSSGPGPSRKQVATHLNLSSATVSKAVAYLIDQGYIVTDAQRQHGRPGRREEPLLVNRDRCYLAGVSIREPRRGQPLGELCGVVIDLGATVVSTEGGSFEGSAPRDVVAGVAELVQKLLAPYQDRAVGFGVALGGQVVSSEGLVRHSWNFDPPWEDVQLAKRLYEATELDVEIENDASALALYQKWFRSGRGRDDFAVGWLTTDGVGFGIVANGKLLHGHDGVNGELGHAEIDPSEDAEECRCGKRGCAEVFIRSVDYPAKGKTRRAPGNRLERVKQAGDALGRVLAQMQLTTASSSLIICGEGLAHEPEFQDAVTEAFERRPFVGPARRVIEWQDANEEQVAQGAATILLRHLPFVSFPRPALI